MLVGELTLFVSTAVGREETGCVVAGPMEKRAAVDCVSAIVSGESLVVGNVDDDSVATDSPMKSINVTVGWSDGRDVIAGNPVTGAAKSSGMLLIGNATD